MPTLTINLHNPLGQPIKGKVEIWTPTTRTNNNTVYHTGPDGQTLTNGAATIPVAAGPLMVRLPNHAHSEAIRVDMPDHDANLADLIGGDVA